MQTRALRTLVEIGRAGSFVAAASRLNMTLSAVSMQMKALEGDLGAALFDRTFRPPRLTPLGRSVCEQALQLLTVEDALRASCEPADRLSGRYRIGFVPTASVRLLPGFLLNARPLLPEASFEVVTGLSDMLEEKVHSGELDFAVVTAGSSTEAGIAYVTLREEDLAFAAPPSSGATTAKALARDNAFLHFMPSSGIGKLISARMDALVGVGRRDLVLDSVEAIMECVNHGVGFTLLPEPDIRRYALPETRVFAAGAERMSRTLALASSPVRHHAPHVKRVAALFAAPDRVGPSPG